MAKNMLLGFRGYFTPFNLLMMFLWSYSSIIYFVNIFLSKMGGMGKYFTPILLIVLILASIHEIKKKIKKEDILFYLTIIVVFLLQYVFYPQNSSILNNYAGRFLLSVVPFFFFGLLINIDDHKEPFFWVSIISLFVQFLYQLWYRPLIGEYVSSEDIVAAYQIAPHVCFLFWIAFDKKRIVYYVLAIIALVFQISLGNRGSVVCVILFLLYCFFTVASSKKRAISKILILAAFFFVIFYFNRITDYLATLFTDYNMSVRILSKLASNEFGTSESRQWLTKTLLEAVSNGPAFGYGLAGDRTFAGVLYAHNFVVEIFVAFGYVFGGLILAVIVAYTVKAFISAKRQDDRIFLVLLICCFMKLMVSGTYLEDTELWILLGYSTSLIRSSKQMKSNSLSLGYVK